jgi:hypothetical protein
LDTFQLVDVFPQAGLQQTNMVGKAVLGGFACVLLFSNISHGINDLVGGHLGSPNKKVKGNHHKGGNGYNPKGDICPIGWFGVLFNFKHG